MKHPSQTTPCQHVDIAHSDVGDVAVCPDCGVVHVSLQYFSMRFDLEAFRALAQMLGTAQTKIERLGEVSQTRSERFDSLNTDGLLKGVIH